MSMPKEKPMLLDALRDLPPAQLAEDHRRKVRRPDLLRRLLESEEWPDGWDLAAQRCRGLNGAGRQCRRRTLGAQDMCYAHGEQTAGHVHGALQKRLAEQVRDPSVTPSVHSDRGGTKNRSARTRGTGRGSNLREVPEDRRCTTILSPGEAGERRCSSWTIAVADGVYDVCCVAHSKDPRAKRARKVAAEVGRAGLETRNDYDAAVKRPIFNGELKTQDDVAAARMALLRKLEVGGIAATNAKVMDSMLKNVSIHIERFGTHQGAEGGAGVLRLLPGTTLVEMDTELDYVLTKDDLDAIEAGLAVDERAGVPTPENFADIIERYLGKRTRRHDSTRAQLCDRSR